MSPKKSKLLSALVATAIAVALPAPASAATTTCPKSTSYSLHTTDARSTNPVWKTSFSAYTTYTLFIADDMVGGKLLTGVHTEDIFLNMPGGGMYQKLTQTFGATSGDAITCGRRLWQGVPVAGTWIDQYGVYGLWSADVYVDGVYRARTTFTIDP